MVSWLGIIFCFLLFPAFVLDTSLQSLFELQLKNRRQQIFSEITSRNELISSYDDERKYYERLLKKLFDLAHQQNSSLNYLEKALERLKKNYPGQFEFVVWNNRGQVIEKLTDEKRYRYVLKKLFEVLKDVHENMISENPIEIKELTSVKANLNIIRQFLGRVFLPETLRNPYQRESDEALILADYGKERPYFWYQIGEKFGILAFLNWDLIKGHHGLNKLCKTINRHFPDSFCGYTHIRALDQIQPTPPPYLQKEALTGLARFESIAEQEIEQNDSFMSVQLLNSKIRIFTITGKDRRFFDIDARKTQILCKLALLYGIGLLLIYFNFAIRKAFFSIRLKLLLLFLYSNIAPLAVLGFVAYDYLQHQRVAFRDHISMESARLLRDFDARYEQQKHNFTIHLNRKIDAINASGATNLDDKTIGQIKAMTRSFEVTESFLFSDDGKTIFAFNENGKNLNNTVRYFKTLAEGVLRYMNRIIQKADRSDMLSKITSPEDSDFIRNSVRDSRKIWPINIGDSVRMGYWNFFGKPKEYINRYFLLLMWTEESLQRIYVRNNLKNLKNNLLGIIVHMRSAKTGRFLSPTSEHSKELQKFMRRIEEKGNAADSSLNMAGEKFVGMGMVGNKLNSITLCALFPESGIDEHVRIIAGKLFAGAFLSIILTTVLGILVAHQFMKPVKTLANAAEAINQQNYRHRVSGLDHDEFGHLGGVINRVTEGLGELEIAKVVQESLFPDETFSQDDYEVFGKSVVMTTLGGDYFDYFKIDDENFGVIIGDVAGHGVGAALIMAMAKARVIMTDEQQRLDPALLTGLVHQILLNLKSRNLRRMMTFQYLVINSKTGLVRFCNAGHCYPLLVKSGSSQYIELVGSPLGAGKRARYLNLEFNMNPGDSLILYTDGIIEAQNSDQQPLDLAGLQIIAERLYDSTPRNYYDGIFNAYINWAGDAGDDTTIIVIGRKKK
jgi:HAMP domain-containing protein